MATEQGASSGEQVRPIRKSIPPSGTAASLEDDRGIIDAHRLLVMWISVATLGVGLTVAGTVLPVFHSKSSDPQSSAFLLVVTATGGLGGFVSSLRRLYGFQDIFPRRR
jgi:hypothetical protein